MQIKSIIFSDEESNGFTCDCILECTNESKIKIMTTTNYTGHLHTVLRVEK